jgi:IQ and AAA domain-containing protein
MLISSILNKFIVCIISKLLQGPKDVTIFQAFQHFACLYIKYLQIFRKLEYCYDCMIHPQKRLAVKSVLERVIRRVLELKNDLVKWNPPNSYVRIPTGPEEAFPWEYVHLDDILVDLKLSPEMLEIPVPRYFREDIKRQIEQRDRIVLGYMRLKHNTDKMYIADHFDSAVVVENMTLERAIEIIQRNERGRQGLERAVLVRVLREKERQGRIFESNARVEMDTDLAATNLQRVLKGFISRTEAARERENELMFIGMRPRRDNLDVLDHELQLAYLKRKQEQQENKESYEKALEDLKEIIADEEGPEKKEELREERTLWVTDQIAQEKFPEDLDDFYQTKMFVDEGAGEEPAPGKGKDAKGAKDEKKGKKDDKKGGDKGKGKGGKKGKGDEEAEAMPKLQGRTELTDAMAKCVAQYEDVWDGRDESDNFQQKHDVELGKEVVRPGVYEEIRAQVDEMLVMNLKKIKMQVAPAQKGKKGKGKKKKGGKGKKGKGKKKKPLPGEKISELKGLDADQMLAVLIENKLVVRARNRTVSSLIGDFNYLGSVHHNADRKDEAAWEPQDPSIAQLRQSITEYCILPNGSGDIKANCAKQIKSVMLYGPSGAGKTHAVEAVAHELGALLIHLNPAKLRGQFGGKSGPTKLVHMVMTVARDPAMQPCVIYIDECEQFFTGGKKSKDKDGPSRFKKDFLLYKNQALEPEHRVIIIGTSRTPENGDTKDMKGFFDKFLYFPYPDYPSRVLIWKHYLAEKILEGMRAPDEQHKAHNNANMSQAQRAQIEDELAIKVRLAMERVNISSLAHVSEGYSAGAIARTVRIVITPRRVAMVRLRPLSNYDFIDNLSFQDVNYQDDKAAFMEFTRQITGLADRRKKVEQLVSGEPVGGAKKGDKKGGKKK